MAQRRAVITGCGAFTSLGVSVASAWDAMMRLERGYQRVAPEDERVVAKFFGLIDPEVLERHARPFSRRLMRMLSPFAKHAVIAADEALRQAFGDAHARGVYRAEECGVIVGTGWGGLDASNATTNAYRTTGFANSFGPIMAMNNSATAALTMLYGLRGYQCSPVGACAAGTIAIGEAAEVIRSGRAKMMLAGGSESLRDACNVWSIDTLQALSKEQDDPRKASCPFSSDRSGFVLSEGGAVVVLEDMASAVERGAPILAEVVGYGNYSDAYDFTAPAPESEGRIHAIQEALRQAGLMPEDIDYINAHGTSTELNDYLETKAFRGALGKHAERVPISSTKSYTGHLIGAAGAFETIVCVKAMQESIVPATTHLDSPDPRCDLDYVPNAHRSGLDIAHALNVNAGFGGANAALLLARGAA